MTAADIAARLHRGRSELICDGRGHQHHRAVEVHGSLMRAAKPTYDRHAARFRLAEGYAADNLAAARIHLSDSAKYPGALQEWAQRILAEEECAQPGRAA